jgi:hypothetical protein
MIELAFIACLSAGPPACRDQSLLYVDVSLMLCVLRGQAQLAAWSEQNPDWEIQEWACRIHDPRLADT